LMSRANNEECVIFGHYDYTKYDVESYEKIQTEITLRFALFRLIAKNIFAEIEIIKYLA